VRGQPPRDPEEAENKTLSSCSKRTVASRTKKGTNEVEERESKLKREKKYGESGFYPEECGCTRLGERR